MRGKILDGSVFGCPCSYLMQLLKMFLTALKLCTHRLMVSHGPGSGILQPPKHPQWKQQQRQPVDRVSDVRTMAAAITSIDS